MASISEPASASALRQLAAAPVGEVAAADPSCCWELVAVCLLDALKGASERAGAAGGGMGSSTMRQPLS